MQLVGLVIYWLLQAYVFVLFARMLLSWVPVINPRFEPRGIVLIAFEAVYSLTDPPIKLARRLLPPGPSFGGIRLDLGFLIVFIAVLVLMRVNAFIFFR